MSKAEILIEAQGDLDVALEISVKESSKTTAKWLSDMGADPRPALLHFANQGNDNALTALIYDGLSDSEEVEHVLSNAVISGNATATRALLEAEPGAAETGLLRRWSILGDTQALKFMFDAGAVGDEALLAIAKDTTLSVGEKVNALRLLLSFLPNAGADTDYLLKELMTEGRADIKAMKCLVAAGVPTVEILMDQAKAGNLLGASALIKSGADYATAMKTLANDAQQDAVNVLGVAMAYGRKS